MKTWRQLLGLDPVKPLESPISYLPPEKKEYKGFLKKTYGSLDEATLTVHPNGIAIVSWCSKNYHIPNYDEKNSKIIEDDNKKLKRENLFFTSSARFIVWGKCICHKAFLIGRKSYFFTIFLIYTCHTA